MAAKSRADRRGVPVAAVRREELLAQLLRTGRERGLVFGRDGSRPFDESSTPRPGSRSSRPRAVS